MRARFNDTEVVYTDAGCGPAVMVLHDHDAPQGEALQKCFEPLVTAGYRVILVELPASAEESPEQGDFLPAAEKAAALLTYLGIGRAAVIGVSRGGGVLLEMMAHCPERIAAGSLVLDPAMVRLMREQTGSAEVRSALQQGRPEALREAFRAAAAGGAGQAALGPLRSWAESVRRRCASPEGKNLAALLGLQLPPLLMAGGEDAWQKKSSSVGWGRRPALKGIAYLNRHLSSLLGALMPREEFVDEEEVANELA